MSESNTKSSKLDHLNVAMVRVLATVVSAAMEIVLSDLVPMVDTEMVEVVGMAVIITPLLLTLQAPS